MRLKWEINDSIDNTCQIANVFFFVSGKTFCQSCKKKCSGEVLRVQDKYFHIGCFKCAQCNASLAQGGFFAREGSYYCTKVSHIPFIIPVLKVFFKLDEIRSFAEQRQEPKIPSVCCSIYQDYRERWGTRCAGCGEYVEGDVVTAGEKHAFHPNCFHCQRCRQPLLGQGTKVSLVQGTCRNRNYSRFGLRS